MYFKVDNLTVPIPDAPEEVVIEVTNNEEIPKEESEGSLEKLTTPLKRTLSRKSTRRNVQTITNLALPKAEEWTLCAPMASEASDITQEDTTKVPPPVVVTAIAAQAPMTTEKVGSSKEADLNKEIRMSVAMDGNEKSSVVVEAKVAPSPIQSNGTSPKKSAPPGIITRFNIPVPQGQVEAQTPVTHHDRRRSLSYANVLSDSGEKRSVEEWVNQLKDRPEGLNNEILRSPTKKTPTKASPLKQPIQEEPVPEPPQQQEEESGPKVVAVINAVFVGTDTDFLETSKMRSLFRGNSLSPEEAKLFEMPEVTEETRREQETEDLIWDCCCSLTPEEMANASPCTRAFHRYKCYLLASSFALLILAFVIAVVIVSRTGQKS